MLYEPNFNDPDVDIEEGAKIGEDEEIIPQFIIVLSRHRLLLFPLKSAVHLGRGILCDLTPGQKKSFRCTSAPKFGDSENVAELTRPGVSVQRKSGRITDILFLGGN